MPCVNRRRSRFRPTASNIMAMLRHARMLLRASQCSSRLGPLTSPTFASPTLVREHRLSPTDDEMYQRTTVSIMQKEAGSGILIHSYSQHGFNIDRNRVVGPCAILPPAILQWNVGNYKDISEESLALFYLLEPRIEVLVLGTGAHVERLDPKILGFMKAKGIAVEIQDTPNACATFNFLSSERRLVAAGLIPPTTLKDHF